MIRIQVSRDKNNDIKSFSVKGHAFAEEHGEDIVCASVSVLAQTTVLSLYEVGNIDVVYEINDGWLYCELPDDLDEIQRERATTILKTMLIGIKAIQEMYSDYIELS